MSLRDRLIAAAADDIVDRVRLLASPKEAAMALLIAHVQITIGEEMGADAVAGMLAEYRAKFLTAMFEVKTQ